MLLQNNLPNKIDYISFLPELFGMTSFALTVCCAQNVQCFSLADSFVASSESKQM